MMQLLIREEGIRSDNEGIKDCQAIYNLVYILNTKSNVHIFILPIVYRLKRSDKNYHREKPQVES